MKIQQGTGFSLNMPTIKGTPEDPVEGVLENLSSSAPAEENTVLDDLARRSGTNNMLANNFVDEGAEPSRYIQGMLTTLQLENEFQNSMNAIVETGKIEAEQAVDDRYAERILAGQKAGRAAKEKVEEEVTEEETQRLEREREEAVESERKKLEESLTQPKEATDASTGASDVLEESGESAPNEQVASSGSRSGDNPIIPEARHAGEAGEPSQAETVTASQSVNTAAGQVTIEAAAAPGALASTQVRINIVV